MAAKRDISTLVTLLAFLLANALNIVDVVKQDVWWNNHGARWYDLDPTLLRERWSEHMSVRAVRTVAGVCNALAWFCFLFPLTKLSYVLSSQGGTVTRRQGLHLWMVLLGYGAFFTECVSRLMTMGMENILDWVSRQFNLDDWGAAGASNNTATTNGDQIGWRVVELLHTITNGILMWVEVFEWLAMGGIMLLVFVSISTNTVSIFPRRFGMVSGIASILSVLTFTANVFRLDSHRVFAPLQITLIVLNVLIFYPIWFITLARTLPDAQLAPAVEGGAAAPPPKRPFYVEN